MRRKTKPALLAAAALVVLFGLARPAAAQEGEGEHEGEGGHDPVHQVEVMAQENGATEIDSHCIGILADGGSVEDCHEAPNPLLPEVNEIIWGSIGFLVVFFFLAKFGFPAMKKAMNDRTEKIRGDIEAAEHRREEAESLNAEYRAQLNDAKAEAGRIIEEARQSADNLRRDAEARLQAELAEERTRAMADIEAGKSRAMADLRNDVASLAIGAAEAVVQRNLDASTQTQLIDDYIDQVAAQRS